MQTRNCQKLLNIWQGKVNSAYLSGGSLSSVCNMNERLSISTLLHRKVTSSPALSFAGAHLYT